MTMSDSARVEFRIKAPLKREIEEAAELLGISFTAFATEALVERARRVKNDYHVTVLRGEEAKAFVEVMTRPRQMSEKLRKTLNTRSVEIEWPK
jgi:uncharacterized protein (DUF1778 family)